MLTLEAVLTKKLGLAIPLADVHDVRRAGVEHEYQLWAADEQVDFRTVLPAVAGHLRCLDPGDPRARRLPSMVALTADGREAELATPPLVIDGGTPQSLDRLLAVERSRLAAATAPSVDAITGFSTHVNVSVPDAVVAEVAQLFARRCGVAAAMIGEPASSAGLFVRARRGRLEVGGEYAEGDDLVASLTFVLAAVAALCLDRDPPSWPEPEIVASREKFGWFLPPTGSLGQVLREGRRTRLDGTADAGLLLARTWAWARPACLSLGLDPTPVDSLVAGAPLRLESVRAAGLCSVDHPTHLAGDVPTRTAPRSIAGGPVAESVWLTWQHAVWGVFDGDRALYAVVGAGQEAEFLARLDAGDFDAAVRRELGRDHGRRRLMVHAQLTGPTWWHDVRPGALVPAERGPDGSLPAVSYRRAARRTGPPSAWQRPRRADLPAGGHPWPLQRPEVLDHRVSGESASSCSAPERQNRRSARWLPAVSVCAPVGIRTPNLLIRSQMLYPLSYRRPPCTRGNPAQDWSRIADRFGHHEITAATLAGRRSGTA